jgi:hypothetical protein
LYEALKKKKKKRNLKSFLIKGFERKSVVVTLEKTLLMSLCYSFEIDEEEKEIPCSDVFC